MKNQLVSTTASKLALAWVVATLGLTVPVNAEDKAPRDAASGQATGKRQHLPVAPGGAGGEAAVEHEVSSPRDAASGLSTGKRQHKPIRAMGGDLDSDKDAGGKAQDHNSSRSNKSGIANDPDADNDGVAEDVVSPRDASSGLPTGKRQ